MSNQEESILNYFKELAAFEDQESHKASLINEQKSKSWINVYDKVKIEPHSVLKKYLNPNITLEPHHNNSSKIFPFGANTSQISAVANALDNQISIIEGPPETGKTQTILNIIANLLIRNKSVLIISNNNKAIENIKDKMKEYGLDFLIAFLGNKENKEKFLATQITEYSQDILNWNFRMKKRNYLNETLEELKEIFIKKEIIAKTTHELSELKLEFSYFKDIYHDTTTFADQFSKLSSKKLMSLINVYDNILRKNKGKKISLLTKIKIYWKYRLKIYQFKDSNALKFLFYQNKIKELTEIITTNEKWLLLHDEKRISNQFYGDSLKVLKKNLFLKYNTNEPRKQFEAEDLWQDGKSEAFVKEYPIVLSTTHSAFDTLNSKFDFDYVIMDEASQVRAFNTLPILSRAKNLVVVGDTKQLQDINEHKEEGNKIFQKYRTTVDDFYNDSTNNFLASIAKSNPKIKRVILKEHYRCHPQIINFCNKKFYNNELIIMTKDHGEKNVLELQETTKGNHADWSKVLGTFNPREIETIKLILKDGYFANLAKDKIGIISPYRRQCNEITKELNGEIEAISTVHKMQGNEKDAIIFSTAANYINNFVNNPELINVAISRAKEKFILVTNGNKQQSKTKKTNNIEDLIEYIKYINKDYMNEEIRVESIFDLLYSQYKEERKKFLKNTNKISKYDSENIFNVLLIEVIKDYQFLDIAFQYPLKLLIKNKDLLKAFPDLMKFAANNWTHLDFIVYNKITKRPILAIEVDGYSTHGKDSKQIVRDTKKDKILDLYDFPLLRLSTKGSQEDIKIKEMLDKILF